MDLLKSPRHKSLFGEVLHILLNLVLAVALFALVYIESMTVAVALVLVSKWRVLAVRPRFWRANVLANIVDITVSLSVVGLMYLASSTHYSDLSKVTLQAGIATIFAVWLLFIKPRSSQRWVNAQAAIALFLGIWVISALAHTMWLWAVVVLFYVVGYGAARHVLVNRDEDEPGLVSMIFGLVIAELGFISYHWMIAYGSQDMGDFKVSQFAIVGLLVGAICQILYTAITDKKSLKSSDVLAPVVFSVVTIAALVIVLGSAGTGIF